MSHNSLYNGSGARQPILAVEDLTVGFSQPSGGSPLVAVEQVNFSVRQGETLCLVGESGCGKSVTALSILRLLPSPPARLLGGRITFEGQDLAALSDKALRQIRGNKIGMVFQEPMTSLNPVLRIGFQIRESLLLHKKMSKNEAKEFGIDMLAKVGIPRPDHCWQAYPHELSGGMRQRVMIAMALSCSPRLVIADEPTTALDVTIQEQILGLMDTLIQESQSSLLLITHDFGVVEKMARRVAVMYAGRVVESGPVDAVLHSAAHPYTRGLLLARPSFSLSCHQDQGQPKRRLCVIPGTVPSLGKRPEGCAFHPRCAEALPQCAQEAPPCRSGADGHMWSCWLA